MTVRDYQRERILSGKALEEAEQRRTWEEEPLLTHVQEQELLKAEMKKAFSFDKEEEDDEDDSGLLSVRVKSEEEIAREEEEYRNFYLKIWHHLKMPNLVWGMAFLPGRTGRNQPKGG